MRTLAAEVVARDLQRASSFRDWAVAPVNGLLVCWGANEHGQIRNIEPRLAEQIGINIVDARVATWFDISAGAEHTCGIGGSGDERTVYCWGSNKEFQSGGPNPTDVVDITEVVLPSGAVPAEIDAGVSHTCVVSDSSQLFCWGSNSKWADRQRHARHADASANSGHQPGRLGSRVGGWREHLRDQQRWQGAVLEAQRQRQARHRQCGRHGYAHADRRR